VLVTSGGEIYNGETVATPGGAGALPIGSPSKHDGLGLVAIGKAPRGIGAGCTARWSEPFVAVALSSPEAAL
jgi:hypothetical protein